MLWGGNQVAIKVGLEGLPPIAMAVVRFTIGWIVVAAAALITRQRVALDAGEWRPLAGLCVIFVIQIATLNIGTQHTSASRSIVLISAYPFFTAAFAHLLIPGDRLARRQVAGMILSFVGIACMFAESLSWTETEHLFGDLVVLLSAALLGLRQVVLKLLVADAHPYKVLFWQALMSLPVFFLLSWMVEGGVDTYSWSWRVAAGVLYQGVVVAGVCFIILVSLLSRHSAGKLGVFGFATPAVGVALSLWITGDVLTMGLVASMALVGAGIVITQTTTGSPPMQPPLSVPASPPERPVPR